MATPAGLRARRSSHRIDTSRREVREIGYEAFFVFEAAQVEYERLLLDTSDQRDRQRAQRGCKRLQLLAAAGTWADGNPRAGYCFHRQRARPDLATALDNLDRE